MFRKVITAAGLTVLAIGLATVVAAQEKYPSRPVDFICTWGLAEGPIRWLALWASSSSRFWEFLSRFRISPAPREI